MFEIKLKDSLHLYWPILVFRDIRIEEKVEPFSIHPQSGVHVLQLLSSIVIGCFHCWGHMNEKRKGEKAASRANHDTFGIRIVRYNGGNRFHRTYIYINTNNQVIDLTFNLIYFLIFKEHSMREKLSVLVKYLSFPLYNFLHNLFIVPKENWSQY